MPTIFEVMRLIVESEERTITLDKFPALFKKIIKLKKNSMGGKMSLQNQELVELYRYFKQFSSKPDFEGEVLLPGYKDIKLERIGNNYFISLVDTKLEQAKTELSNTKNPQA